MTQPVNHINSVRQHLLDQLSALRNASTPEALKDELARSKGVSELAQTITNTAKVEVDYLVATGQTSTPFLEAPPGNGVKPGLPKPAEGSPAHDPFGASTIHRLQG